MGLFFAGDEERFTPGGRKSGFPRYKEVLEGNWKDFIRVGFITLLFFVPLAAGMVYAVLSQSALAAVAAGLLGGAISGPGFACMEDLILRRLRDDLADWWVCWKRSMGQNWASSLLPGAVQGLFLGVLVFAGALILWGAAPITPANLVLLAVAALLGTMVLTIWWPQVVLFRQKALLQLRNAVFFCLFHFGKVAGAAALQMVWWAVMFLFLPWTAFVVPVLGVWYILFVALHLIYPVLDEDFRLEESIAEAFPERVGR